MRGYALSGDERFLEPYAAGRRNADAAMARLQQLAHLDGVAQFRDEIDAVAAAARAWETGLRRADDRAGRAPTRRGRATSREVEAGKARFDRFRAAVAQPPGAADPGARDGARPARRSAGVVLVLGDLHRRRDPAQHVLRRARPAQAARAAARAARRARARGGARRLRARGRRRRARREVVNLARRRRRDARPDRGRARGAARGRGRPQALQRRARAVRLRRLARPPGAAAQGRELLPAAAAALRRAARRRAPTSTSASPSTARGGCRT